MAVPKNSRNLECTAECGSQPPAYAQCCFLAAASSSYMERSFYDPAPDLAQPHVRHQSPLPCMKIQLAYQLPLLWEISAILA